MLYIIIVFTILIAFISIVFLLDEIFKVFWKPTRGPCHQRLKFRVESSIFKINLLRINTFSLTFVFTKAVPIKHVNCSSGKISIYNLVVSDVTRRRWRIKNIQLKFCKNDLVMRTSI